MSLRQLPEARNFNRPQNFQWDAPSDVLEKWAASPKAAAEGGDNVISIMDVIGEDYWSGGGFTAKRASAALRSIGERDIVVNINSPGGDVFEGVAIYNLLRAHKGKVTVNVLGMAASIASIIAMAGDEIAMGLGSMMMVHNAWGVVVGNKNDLRAGADVLDSIDSSLIDIYEARTGKDRKTLAKLMDAETFLAPQAAIDNGFADRLDSTLTGGAGEAPVSNQIKARRQIEAALAKTGMTRMQRHDLMTEISGAQRDASSTAARDAGEMTAAARQLIDLFKL